jgi:hypothetical protein
MDVKNKSGKLMETALHECLYDSLVSITPRVEVSKRLFAKISQNIRVENLRRSVKQENPNAFSDAGWIPYLPLIDIKILHRDAHNTTVVFRLAPSARFEPHKHQGTEELLILNGEIYIDGTLFRTGDYQLSESGSEHNDVYTLTGCFALVIAPTEVFRV